MWKPDSATTRNFRAFDPHAGQGVRSLMLRSARSLRVNPHSPHITSLAMYFFTLPAAPPVRDLRARRLRCARLALHFLGAFRHGRLWVPGVFRLTRTQVGVR